MDEWDVPPKNWTIPTRTTSQSLVRVSPWADKHNKCASVGAGFPGPTDRARRPRPYTYGEMWRHPPSGDATVRHGPQSGIFDEGAWRAEEGDCSCFPHLTGGTPTNGTVDENVQYRRPPDRGLLAQPRADLAS